MQKYNKSVKSLFKAVALITFFTIITRILGFFFRIYLSREIGAEALGIYQVAVSVFMVLLTVVASGLPMIISKISSSLHSQKRAKEEFSMITTALLVSVILALATCLIVLLFRNLLGFMFTDDKCVIILIILLPAVVFNAIYSTFRGYFWGHSNYFTVCVVELFEQIARIVLFVLMIGGFLSITDGALTASLSLTIACFFSATLVTVLYFVYGGKLSKPKGFTKELIKTSTPITAVRIASSLIQPVIAIIVPLRLVSFGMDSSEALSLLGIALGMTLPFLSIPSTLISSLGMALVPDLASAQTQNNTVHIQTRINTSIIITLFVSCFFVPLFMGTGENIGLFFFDNLESGYLLMISAWIMVPISLASITSSILNTLGYELKSLKNYVYGAIVLLLCIWFLPKYIGINSIIWGMGLCMTVSTLFNIKMINKITTSKIKIGKELFIMLLISLPVTAVTSFLTNILSYCLPLFVNLSISCIIGSFMFILLCQVFDLLDLKIVVSSLKNKYFKKIMNKKQKVGNIKVVR